MGCSHHAHMPNARETTIIGNHTHLEDTVVQPFGSTNSIQRWTNDKPGGTQSRRISVALINQPLTLRMAVGAVYIAPQVGVI
ncbi:MAG: hypothetical protein HC804_03775 [Anaerolineae bacterium]|nr:hypothetical protein [Anaerolineae bacterium]